MRTLDLRSLVLSHYVPEYIINLRVWWRRLSMIFISLKDSFIIPKTPEQLDYRPKRCLANWKNCRLANRHVGLDVTILVGWRTELTLLKKLEYPTISADLWYFVGCSHHFGEQGSTGAGQACIGISGMFLAELSVRSPRIVRFSLI